jgi:hypothetical protein
LDRTFAELLIPYKPTHSFGHDSDRSIYKIDYQAVIKAEQILGKKIAGG